MIVPGVPTPQRRPVHRRVARSRTDVARWTPAAPTPDTATPAIDVQVPRSLGGALDRLIDIFVAETGTSSRPALPFLHALQCDAAQGATRCPGLQRQRARDPLTAALVERHDLVVEPPGATPAGRGGRRAASKSSSSAQRSADAAAERIQAAPKARPRHAQGLAQVDTEDTAPATSSTPSASSTVDNTADPAGGTQFADVIASCSGSSARERRNSSRR